MPNILIDLAAEFTGKKAFDKAESATTGLTKGVQKLGAAIGIAFSTQAIVNYTKAAVKAASADQKATQLLAVNLKNVGLAYASADAEGFIKSMEKQTTILDDELRPAYAELAKVTGSVIKTQQLMKLAFDLAAANGLDFGNVIDILSKAYVGNYKGLNQLNTGLTKAELATKSFTQIQKILIQQSAGAGQKSLDNYAGSVDKLNVALSNAQETLGYAFMESFVNLAGDGNIDQATSKIDTFTASLSKMIVTASKLKWYDWIIGGITGGTITDITKFQGMGNVAMTGGSNMDTQKSAAAAAKKAEAAALKRAKELQALQLKSLKAEQNKAKLAQAARLLELKQINIAAALKGKISEEERIRLLLLQAIADEDGDKAEALSKKLEEIQKKNEAIAKSLMEIGQAKDPFSTWSTSLTAALLELNKVGEKMFAIRQRESGFVDTSILGGGGTTFPKDATPEQIVAIVETAVVAAETAATEAAASVEATQTVTEALAKSADAAVAVAETLGIIDTANVLGVNADIATQTQSSSIFNPLAGMTTQSVAAARALDLIASGSNAGAGTASSMFNPYATTPGSSAGFGNAVPYVYVTVNNNGSVIMQDEFVEAVNTAVLTGQRTGYSRTAAGSLVDSG